MRLRPASRVLVVVACLLGLGACGDDGEKPVADRAPSVPTGTTGPTAPASTGPTGATATPPEPEPSTTSALKPTPPTEPTEPGKPGPGDEEPIRQPVSFRIGGADVEPGSISVSPFLAIELELENVGSTPLIVRLVGTDTTIEVAAGETRSRRLAGLKAGLYTLSVNDGAQVGTVVVGDDVGP